MAMLGTELDHYAWQHAPKNPHIILKVELLVVNNPTISNSNKSDGRLGVN